MGLVDEVVVVDEIAVAGVVRRVDVDAANDALVVQAQRAERVDGKGGATSAPRWNLGKRVRDIEEAPDGSLWMVEDTKPGGLYRLTPK